MIAAILRAQWLSMRMGANRAAVFSLITGLIRYGIWTGVAYGMFVLVAAAPAGALQRYLPLGLLGICVYWQAMPILSASMGSSLDMRKLLVYPAPHGKLFLVEVLLRLTTGIEMLMILAGGAAGLLRNRAAGGWSGLPRVLGGVLIYVLFNLLLASGTRSLLERLLSRRRVREILVFFLLMLWMVPRFVMLSGYRTGSLDGWSGAVRTAVWPWTAAAYAVLGQSQSVALLSLICWTLLAAWFGRFQFERGLRFDVIAAQAQPLNPGAGRLRALTESFYRFPASLWRDPLAAIVEKELRSLARTPRYRMVFVMGFSFGLMVWLPMILGGRASRHTELSSHFLTVVCVYALTLLGQVSYWNCFGFDRSAAQIYFTAPQPLSKTLLGKNLAALVFIYLEAAILTAITLAFRIEFGVGQLLETLVVLAVCSLYMMALGNISSVQYPRGLNPVRVSQGGASSRFQALVFLFYPISLIPVSLAYLARYAFNSETVFGLVLGFAAAIGAVVYWIAMESAVTTAVARREQIIQHLSRGEGPVASG